ncbi:hypothetical protein D0Z07_9253 [Hyphodiscus hymeniophilus]|uniref:DUF7728 domain-containing protein n=1 Tax=Hyphodiscus hymeniophilus TaxID=353542 RepID=A0A9P6SKH0_9HELO|nr:hypothetical protein D0Z07_9253 [Hyphodiscus hymeniophilus]
MRFSQLGATLAAVAQAQAFLLPPTITEADSDIINILPFEDAVSIKDQAVEIPCPGCPVAITDLEGKMHSAQVENILRLNFSLSLNEQDRLLMNDIQIYPIDAESPTSLGLLTADQLVKSPGGVWQYAASPKLGYSLMVSHPSDTSNNEQLDLILVKLEVLEVADKFVDRIPAVVIKLLETPSGKLMIGDTEIIAVPSRVSAPIDSGKECTTILCKWRAIIAGKLSKIKGCAGKNRHGGHGKQSQGLRPHGHGRPRPHGPHRPHRHYHRSGGFARFLRSIALHVFVPIMIGVVVGVTTSLVGMVVGHLIVFLWRAVFRRGQRGQHHRVQEVVVEDGEEKAFLEPQCPPPTYEEAPAYEVATADEKSSA